MIDGQIENASLCFIFAYPRKERVKLPSIYRCPTVHVARGKRHKVAAKHARARST